MRKTLLPILLLFLLTRSLFATANTTQISNASPMRFYMMNYSYANMQSFLPIVSFGLATDLNQIAYKNGSGVLYKLLCDASGAALTPAQRIFFADASGRASSSDNLLFDGTTLKTSKVASLRDSTYDLIAMDSVKANTGTFTEAIAGATLNTGNGDNELYPMNQDVRTTASPTFNKVTSTRDSTSDLIATNSVKSNTGTFTGAIAGATLNTGNGDNELYPMNQDVRTTASPTFNKVTSTRDSTSDLIAIDTAKANTGVFNNLTTGSLSVTGETSTTLPWITTHTIEMGVNKNRWIIATDAYTGDSTWSINHGSKRVVLIDTTAKTDSTFIIRADTVKNKNLKVKNMTAYDTGSFILTFNDSAATQVRAKYIKIFNSVTITIPFTQCFGTGNWINNMRYINSDELYASGVPAAIRPLTGTGDCRNVYTSTLIGASIQTEYSGTYETHGSIIAIIMSDGKILFQDSAQSGFPPGHRSFRINTQNFNPLTTAIPISYIMDR